MSDEQPKSKSGCLIFFVLWIVVVLIAALVWRYVVQPGRDEDLTNQTSEMAEVDHDLAIALDSFSGYAVWRSPELARTLANDRIRLQPIDDQADYRARIKALDRGEVQFAVFTIDAWLTAGAEHGSFPGSIILVNDETTGADAMVAYQQGTPDITALNHADATVIATPDSPSEFLSRVIIAHFHLPELSKKWLREADGAEEVFTELQDADPSKPQAFVLWEPYVARAKQLPGVHVLVDSSSVSGYIVDVLVVQRAFLRDNPEIARRVVEGYLRTAYQHQRQGMQQLIADDAKRLGSPLDDSQVQAVMDGISWANTVDNYAYFGLGSSAVSGPSASGSSPNASIRHIRDSILAINDVLLSTERLKKDPVQGKPEALYYDQILSQLQQEQFHPAMAAQPPPSAGSANSDASSPPLPFTNLDRSSGLASRNGSDAG